MNRPPRIFRAQHLIKNAAAYVGTNVTLTGVKNIRWYDTTITGYDPRTRKLTLIGGRAVGRPDGIYTDQRIVKLEMPVWDIEHGQVNHTVTVMPMILTPEQVTPEQRDGIACIGVLDGEGGFHNCPRELGVGEGIGPHFAGLVVYGDDNAWDLWRCQPCQDTQAAIEAKHAGGSTSGSSTHGSPRG